MPAVGKLPTSLPSRSTVTRLEISSTSARRWLTKTTAMPSAESLRTMSSSASVSDWVSDEVGSSMKMSLAFVTSARAIATIWRWAIGRCAEARRGRDRRPSRASIRSAVRRAWRDESTSRGRAPRLRSKPMFSATVISGNRARSCQMTSMPGSRAIAGRHSLRRATVEAHLGAGRRLVDAGDDLDQRALAAAVFAGDALHFAGQHFEADVVQRLHAAERSVTCSTWSKGTPGAGAIARHRRLRIRHRLALGK